MEKYVKIRIFLKIVMPTEKGNILEFNQYIKSEKIPYIICVDFLTFLSELTWLTKYI